MRKLVLTITLCFMISIFAGCSVLQKIGLQKSESDELQPVSSITMGEEEAEKLSGKAPIRLYFANENNTKLKLEIRYIPVSEAKKSVNNLAATVVKELINGPKSSNLKATVPKGTKLKSSVAIKSGVATVNLSKEFVDKHPGGKDAEQLTIYSIVNSLTQIKEIQKVKFLINGDSREVYKGSFKFDVPFPPNPSLISNDVSLPSPTAGSNDKDQSKSDGEKKSGTDKNKQNLEMGADGQESAAESSTDMISNSGQEPDDSSQSFGDGSDEDAEAMYGEILE